MSKEKNLTFARKYKTRISIKKGSILAYSLIILSMMLIITVTLSASSVATKKSANSTEASAQALQAADSGAQLATKIVQDNQAISITAAFGSCDDSSGIVQVTKNDAGPNTTYTLTFYKDQAATPAKIITSCSDLAGIIQNIKSIGSYKSTARAISMSVSSIPTPMGWWKMDDASGTTAVDSSGNGNNGTLFNGAIWTTLGKIGGALDFNGTDGYVNIANNGGFFSRVDGQELSLSVWINPSRLGGQYQDIVTLRDASVGHNWILYQHTLDGSVQLHGTSQNKSGYVPATGSWTHIVATVNAAGIYNLYANGVLVQGPMAYNFQPASPSILSIGRYPNGSEYYQGKIDNVKIFNRALSASEVMAEYNNGA
jgi:Tfp pilus assembly protein PilX